MPDDRQGNWLARQMRGFQDSAQRAGPAAAASYSLIGAILLMTAIGYGVDAWRGTSPLFLRIGLFVGVVTGFYLLAKTVWHR